MENELKTMFIYSFILYEFDLMYEKKRSLGEKKLLILAMSE